MLLESSHLVTPTIFEAQYSNVIRPEDLSKFSNGRNVLSSSSITPTTMEVIWSKLYQRDGTEKIFALHQSEKAAFGEALTALSEIKETNHAKRLVTQMYTGHATKVDELTAVINAAQWK